MFIVEYFVKDRRDAVKSFVYHVAVSIPRAGDTVCLDGIFYKVQEVLWVYYDDNTIRVSIKVHKEV